MGWSSCYVTTPGIDITGRRLFLSGSPDVTHPGVDSVGKYRLADVGPGSLQWRKQEISSPYVHGSVPVAQVKENMTSTLIVVVEGSNAADLNSNLSLLLRAMEQFYFELHAAMDGEFWVWGCYAANYENLTKGDAFDGNMWRSNRQAYKFSIPRNPIPLAGSI